MKRYFIVLSIFLLLIAVNTAQAQHPIEVQRKAAKGEYLKALATYEKMPKRKATVEATLAAARSAWALGLNEKASAEFDKAIRKGGLSTAQKARALLSRGIIEYQEERYQVSILYAEKVLKILDKPGPLRAKAWLLWGENLYKLNSYGSAEEKYEKALKEAADAEQSDIHYRLGMCQIKLGKLKDARNNFENIPLNHERTPAAIRHLAHIALDMGESDSAAFWLKKGRDEFPDAFLDSWVDYAMLSVALKNNNYKEAKKIRQEASQKYPPSDRWFSILEAEFEWNAWARNTRSVK